jgi:hypothetical protein
VRYTPYFCEENVWHLARDRADRPGVSAVFITNRAKQVALWRQRAGDPVIWDYHVVLFDRADVIDLDSTIENGPTLPLSSWLDGTFLPVPALLAPRFRVVPVSELLRTFSSDRSHMREADGTPRQPFPEWPAIGCALGPHTLPRFLDLDDDIAGEWLDLAALRTRV